MVRQSDAGAGDHLPVPQAGARTVRRHGPPISSCSRRRSSICSSASATSSSSIRAKRARWCYADRTRPRDFEIYRVTHVEDADTEGPDAEIPALFSLGQNRGSGWVYSTERRPRRPTRRRAPPGHDAAPPTPATTSSWPFRARPDSLTPRPLKRIDIIALCTNRDLPILDDTPDADPGERRSGRNGQAAGRRAPAPAGNGGRIAGGRGRRVARRRTGLAAGGAAIAEFPQPCRRKDAAPTRCMRCSTSMPIAAIRASPAMCARSSASSRGRSSKGCRSTDRCASAAAPKSRCMSTSRVLAGQSTLACCRRCSPRLFARHCRHKRFRADPHAAACRNRRMCHGR